MNDTLEESQTRSSRYKRAAKWIGGIATTIIGSVATYYAIDSIKDEPLSEVAVREWVPFTDQWQWMNEDEDLLYFEGQVFLLKTEGRPLQNCELRLRAEDVSYGVDGYFTIYSNNNDSDTWVSLRDKFERFRDPNVLLVRPFDLDTSDRKTLFVKLAGSTRFYSEDDRLIFRIECDDYLSENFTADFF